MPHQVLPEQPGPERWPVLPVPDASVANIQVLPMSENIAKGNRERYGQLEIP